MRSAQDCGCFAVLISIVGSDMGPPASTYALSSFTEGIGFFIASSAICFGYRESTKLAIAMSARGAPWLHFEMHPPNRVRTSYCERLKLYL